MASSDESMTPFITSAFLRIGSIYLSGAVKAQLRSRPLDRDIAPILAFELDLLDDLNNQIQRCSDFNLAQTGRRGCTTDELYELIQAFVTDKVRGFIASTAYDLVTNPFQPDDTRAVRDVKHFISGATSSLLSYATDSSIVKERDIQQSVTNHLQNNGLPAAIDHLKRFNNLSDNLSTSWRLPTNAMISLKRKIQFASDTANAIITEAKLVELNGAKIMDKAGDGHQKGDIFFPEFP